MFSLSRMLLMLTLGVVAFGIALPLAPFAIRALFPPVHSFEVVTAERLPDQRLRLTATLDKGGCVFHSLSFAYHGPRRSVWRVGYNPLDQPEMVGTNRPGGVQRVGPWIVDASPSPDAERLTISVLHRCGLIEVVTQLATLNLSEVTTVSE